MTTSSFHQLIEEAEAAPFSGWDFSFLEGRMHSGDLPWDYRARVLQRLPAATALLDMGTGGGEFLSSLRPLPPATYATEAHPPNLPVARARLAPLGVNVVGVEDDEHLPLPGSTFDLVINRHERFISAELARILRPGGHFITQQVGEQNLDELNRWLTGSGRGKKRSYLQTALSHLKAAGLRVTTVDEAFVEVRFEDVGALVYLLRAVPWQLPGFSVATYKSRLRELHHQIQNHGPLVARDHRYYLEVEKA